MTELEIMMRAKLYIDSLANEKNPLTGQSVNEDDVINNIRISKCLFYVSGILQKVIDNGGEIKKPRDKKIQKLNFNLTDEQMQNLIPEKIPLSSAKVTSLINAQINSEKMKKLKVTTLNNWLMSIGILTKTLSPDNKAQKIPTQDGEMLGPSQRVFTDHRDTHKYVTYDTNAQKFIFDNVSSIIQFSQTEALEK